jgi:PIN domain nuclease of toxin-antitoxin system
MPTNFVIDTHCLIWFLEGNPRLGVKARAVMQDPASQLSLPVIALAEACWIVGKGKTSIPDVKSLLTDVDADPRILLIPLDRPILDISLTLSAIDEMHDRQITATALHLASSGDPVALLTRDVNITTSNLVPTLW